MSETRHYMIFRRTDGHCANWMVRAASVRDAMQQFALDQCADLREDGTLVSQDGYGGQIVYEHPLACIEGQEKIWTGGEDWNGWEIRGLREEWWQQSFAEVFCSENPGDVQDYIELCRPLLRLIYPRSRARAFVWYLEDGPLVTFYRSARPRRRWPIEILARYHIAWEQYPKPQLWTGTYDDISEQMLIDTRY